MSVWSVVSGQTNQESFGTTGNPPISMTANATAGNVVCVGILFFDGTGTPPTITSASDENGKVYTQIPAGWAPSSVVACSFTTIVYCIVPSGAGKTVTVNFSKAASFADLHINEFHPSSGSATFDNSAVSADGAHGSTVTTPTVTVSGSDDLLFAVTGSGSGIASGDSPWTQDGVQDSDGGMAEYLLGASSNTAPAFTQSSSADYACSVVSFSTGATGPTTAQAMPALFEQTVHSAMIGRRFV